MRSTILSIAILAIAVAPALAAEKEVYLQKTDAAGKAVLINQAYDVDQGCSSLGASVIKLLIAPLHGRFSSQSAAVFPNYPPDNPVAHCNSRRVSGRQQFYTSQPGYTGSDSLEFEIIFPTGEANDVHVDIDVM